MQKTSILLGIFCIAINATAASNCGQDPYSPAFIANTYTLIGREPDGGKLYSRQVTLLNVNDKSVKMIERLDHQLTRSWQGHFRTASPGEGCVLSLDTAHDTMSCLISVDLDNGARLSCYWENKNKRNYSPGLAALFRMAATEPNKKTSAKANH